MTSRYEQLQEQLRQTQADSTHFGYESVRATEKADRVAEVFHSVADRYDLMNDLMSGGLHRIWKRFTVRQAALRPGMKVLDIAGGTGDLAKAFLGEVGESGQVWLTDINGSMLARGRDRLLDEGLMPAVAQCDAERLPFPDNHFDRVSVAFGLRNMTRKEQALEEMSRVLRPGGRLLVLEFSRVWKPLERAYDWYSFSALPWLGSKVAGDAESYRYLAESIRMHPGPEELAQMMRDAGFGVVRFTTMTAGVVALHQATRV